MADTELSDVFQSLMDTVEKAGLPEGKYLIAANALKKAFEAAKEAKGFHEVSQTLATAIGNCEWNELDNSCFKLEILRGVARGVARYDNIKITYDVRVRTRTAGDFKAEENMFRQLSESEVCRMITRLLNIYPPSDGAYITTEFGTRAFNHEAICEDAKAHNKLCFNINNDLDEEHELMNEKTYDFETYLDDVMRSEMDVINSGLHVKYRLTYSE